MKVAFSRGNSSNTVPLQIVVQRFHARKSALVGELQFSVFSKTRGIGIKKCAGISKSFENELGSRELVGKFRTLLSWVAHTELEKGLDRQSTIFRLATACLPAGVVVIRWVTTNKNGL